MTNCSYFLSPEGFVLESGESLDGIRIAYNVLGNPQANKTVWVCHALSGNSNPLEWWGGIFGPDKVFDTSSYKIICANVIGSCYGSTGPEDQEVPKSFPLITVRDMVKAHKLLASYLGIQGVDVLIGASLGGQQALEWAIDSPRFAEQLVLIATNAEHSPYGRAFNEAQRLALLSDPTFGEKDGGREGLKAARAIAMLSYRSYQDFAVKQVDQNANEIQDYRASSYVRYQGEKFLDRFKASSYFTLSKAMDSHNVGRGRNSIKEALRLVQSNCLVVGVNSDTLFPLEEQRVLADNISAAELGVIDSLHGHDAFLIEYQQLSILLDDFINNAFKAFKPTVLKTQTNRNEK